MRKIPVRSAVLTTFLAFLLPAIGRAQQSSSFRGTVTGEAGHPVAGAQVRLMGRSVSNANTDSEGRFTLSFSSVPSGALGVTAVGFHPAGVRGEGTTEGG